MVEIIGLFASTFILLSMTVSSNSRKGNLTMRILNLVGSVIFIAYGLLIPAYSTALMNCITAIINTVYICKLTRNNNSNEPV